MQGGSTALGTALAQAYELKATPSVVAEWNHNVHSKISSVSVAGTDPGADLDLFPVDSIVKPNRPSGGMPKARIGRAYTYSENEQFQYRTVDADSIYKYWSSAKISPFTGATVAVQVVYQNSVTCNKLRVTFENSWSSPLHWTLAITTNGTTWTTVSTDGTIAGGNGVFNAYLQNDGSWSPTVNLANSTPIRGVKVTVTQMDRVGAHAEIIELGARLQKDISADCIDFSVNKSLSADDRISPAGIISANTASVTLDNSTNQYGQQNSSGPYYGLLNANTKLTLGHYYDVSAYGGSAAEFVQQGIFYVDTWGDDIAGSVQPSLTDFSKFFQSENCLPTTFKNKYAWEIIGQILEGAGFFNHYFWVDAGKTDIKIPYVWFDGTQTVWQAIQDICRAVQYTASISEYGQLEVQTRDYLFRTQTPSLQLNADNVGATLANVMDVQDSYTIQANKVMINYIPTTLSESEGKPVTNLLWQPTDADEVQSCVLMKPLTSGETDVIQIGVKPSQTFPYTSYVNIEGEIIKYDGKQYKTRVGGHVQYTVCKSDDDKKAADDASDPSTFTSNTFTGKLRNLTRGCFGTSVKAHNIDITGWTGVKLSGASATDASGHFKEDKHKSMLKVIGPGHSHRNKDLFCAYRGGFTDSYHVYGTQLRFSTSRKDGAAGMFFNLQSNKSSGYFIEISTTHLISDREDNYKKRLASINKKETVYDKKKGRKKKDIKARQTADDKKRKNAKQRLYNEVRIYRRYPDGSTKPLAGGASGIPMNITPGYWYQIDATQNGSNIEVFINGNSVAAFTDPYASPLSAGKAGMFVNGPGNVDFEYFYSVKNPVNQHIGDSSFNDLISGDYSHGYVDREVIYRSRENWGRTWGSLYPTIEMIYDDFGPYVHEMKPYDVTFTKFPAWSADLFLGNENAEAVNFRATAFKAHFFVVAKTRNPYDTGEGTVILQGSDNSVSPDNPIQRSIFVYGVTINQGEQKTVTIDNKYYENQQDTVELTFDSPWLQNESMANSLGNWVKAHFSAPCDIKTVDMFADPRIQVGDMVSLNYPAKGILAANNWYHVTAISFGWSNGPTQTLTIRKAVL